MMLAHKNQVGFSDIHLDISVDQIDQNLVRSFRLDFCDIQQGSFGSCPSAVFNLMLEV